MAIADVEAPKPKEELTLALFGAAHMLLTLRGSLAPDRVVEFKKACKAAGATTDRAARTTMVTRYAVGELLARLIGAGFEVVASRQAQLALDFDAETAKERAKAQALRDAETATAVERRMAPFSDILMPFQRTGIEWLALRSSGLLCDEPGLGKTLQTLLALPAAERGGAPPAVLVVCPANAKGVWERECKQWRPDLRVVPLKGEGSFRWPHPGELVVTNYDVLPKPVDLDTSPTGLCVLVGDEVQYVKKPKAQRTSRFRAIREKVTNCGGFTWGLTGTPLPDRAEDLFYIAQAFGLAKDAFGSWDDFVELYEGERVKCPACDGGQKRKKCGRCHGSGIEGDNVQCGGCGGAGRLCKACRNSGEVPGELLRPTPEVRERFARVALLRKKADVLTELPELRYQVHPVSLEGAISEELADLLPVGWEDSLAESLEGAEEGASFEELAHARAMLAEAKIPAALEFAESMGDADRPLVAFSAHSAPIVALAKLQGWALIDGSVSADKRTEIAARFQAGELRGIAANIKAGGTSITLTRASDLLFIDKSWSPGENWQARDRVHRIGQTRGVLIHSLVCEHALDQRVEEILGKKLALIEGSLGA